MTNQAGRAIDAPIPKGSRTPGAGAANGSTKKLSPRSPQFPANFQSGRSQEGTRFPEGPVSGQKGGGGGKVAPPSERGAIFEELVPGRKRDVLDLVVDLDAIKAAGLSDEQVFLAHLLWALRNMLVSLPADQKPLHRWTVPDIIAVARGLNL